MRTDGNPPCTTRDDLTFFALDPADARRSARWDIAFVVLLIGAAAAAAGVVLL
ncbi:hypothetical protein [Streptomyces sp. NPDC056491]|uniref:hypothetical protein n=1 Tax=Streptomyces sp. NPDC056491 TaxID=3345837 RepID=UPI0036A82270